MVNIDALIRALPFSGLEPQVIGRIGGLARRFPDPARCNHLHLLEPPTGGLRIPYVDPLAAITLLMRGQGVDSNTAEAIAHEAVDQLKRHTPADRWIRVYDYWDPDTPACLPALDLVQWLRREEQTRGLRDVRKIPADAIDFIEQAIDVTTEWAWFRGPDNWHSPWTLASRPALPTRKAMIEFVVNGPWPEDSWLDGDRSAPDNPWLQWRETMRPIARTLEEALGQPVYHFGDLTSDHDDDDGHRLLVLHWLCTWKPNSPFVQWLVEVSGAGDVETLKAALVDPASYAHPFEMNSAFIGIEARSCEFEYPQPGVQRTVGVAFSTAAARPTAERALAQRMGTRVVVLTPSELASGAWLDRAARFCASSALRILDAEPAHRTGLLDAIDEVCVVCDQRSPRFASDLKLPEPMEDLLRLARAVGMPASVMTVDGVVRGA